MKSLVISPFTPYPLVFGGAIRIYHMIRMLATMSDVTLIAHESWSDVDPDEHLSSICQRVVIVPGRPRDSVIGRGRSLFSTHSYQYTAHASMRLQGAVDALGPEADVVLVEMTPMGQFALPPGVLSVMDLPNIEHELVRRRADVAGSRVRRGLLGIEAAKVKREELAICGGVDVVLTTSDRETEEVRTWPIRARVETLPNSIDAEYFLPRPDQRTSGPHIAFIGATHVDANAVGLRWFMDLVHPMIRSRLPDLQVTIVGGNPPRDIRAYHRLPGVTVTGYVKDVRDRMVDATALVVPLLSGGGTRLKVLEGLSFGVPTVSTTIGAEGLGLSDGEHILLADTPSAFADAVVRVLTDGGLRLKLSAAGRDFVEARYDWSAVAGQLRTVIESALAEQRGPRS